MLENFALTGIVTALALLVYIWVTLKVGGAREVRRQGAQHRRTA